MVLSYLLYNPYLYHNKCCRVLTAFQLRMFLSAEHALTGCRKPLMGCVAAHGGLSEAGSAVRCYIPHPTTTPRSFLQSPAFPTTHRPRRPVSGLDVVSDLRLFPRL